MGCAGYPLLPLLDLDSNGESLTRFNANPTPESTASEVGASLAACTLAGGDHSTRSNV
jgi:hypothetical protein